MHLIGYSEVSQSKENAKTIKVLSNIEECKIYSAASGSSYVTGREPYQVGS